MTNSFGKLVKSIRSRMRLGLREFCIALDYDPSNWSKIERGLLSPPQDATLLNRIALILGLPDGSEERELLFDYAAIDSGRIPQHVLDDAELVKRLPIFFRTALGKKPKSDDLISVVKALEGFVLK